MIRLPIALALAVLASPAMPQDQELLGRLDAARRIKKEGSPQKASAAYESLLPLLRARSSNRILAEVLFETSQLALALGDYSRAIDRAGEAARLQHLNGDPRNEALALNNAGLARLYRGEYAAALQVFQQSLRLHALAHDDEGVVARLNNIGNVHFFQGKYFDALQSYEEALRRTGQFTNESWQPRRRQLTLANLATLYEQLGQNDRALGYYKAALDFGSAMPPNEYAQLLSNLGTLYRRMGDAFKALETYRSAQRMFALDQHSDGQVHILHNIGIVWALDYGDLQRALATFTSALEAAESTSNKRQIVLGRLFRGEALFRMERFAEARHEFQAGLAGAVEIGATEEQWMAHYGLGRAYRHAGRIDLALEQFQAAIAIIESVRSGLNRASLRSEFLASRRDVYDACIGALLTGPHPDAKRLFALFEQARSRNLQDALSKSMPRATLDAVQAHLAKQSVLIEYWIGKQDMAALWITRTSSGMAHLPVSPDDEARLLDFAAGVAGDAGSGWRNSAAKLGGRLLSGIPLHPAIRHLLIVPDGVLHDLPFEVLVGPSSSRLLLERFAISYLPSAALLLRPAPASGPAMPWNLQLVAFGDPQPAAHHLLAEDEHWTRLPASGDELRHVADAVRGTAEIHSGPGDLKRNLIERATPLAPLLHISSHAAVDLADANRSRILFTPVSGSLGSEYLFQREVQDLSLIGVELATLSGCETEGGKMVRGEGIQSFSRAFLAAGAAATVTTLWRVADRPTAEFMPLFYRRLARGESKAEALRSAKLAFLHSGSDLSAPRYWAAFVLNGDGQIAVRPVLSWAWLIGPLLAAALTLLAAARHIARTRATQHPLPPGAGGAASDLPPPA